MPIYIFVGRMGSGKTLSAVREAWLNRHDIKTIISNVHLNRPFSYKPLTMETIKDYKNWDYKDCLILMDETHTIIDSRLSMTKKNIMISYFLTQSRKRNCFIFCTTQNIRQVEVRLRRMADYIIECESVKKDKKLLAIRQKVIDCYNLRVIKRTTFSPEPYFRLYDTNQIIDFEKGED